MVEHSGTCTKFTRTKPRGGRIEGGRWGENGDNCTWTTVKKRERKKIVNRQLAWHAFSFKIICQDLWVEAEKWDLQKYGARRVIHFDIKIQNMLKLSEFDMNLADILAPIKRSFFSFKKLSLLRKVKNFK